MYDNFQTHARFDLDLNGISTSWVDRKVVWPKAKSNVRGPKRIENRWKSTQVINVETGSVASGSAPQAFVSAQWVFEPVANTNYFMIKNKWKSTYLNVETGPLTAGAIQKGAWSAHWTIEPVTSTSYVRIKNRWKGTYINIEKGKLEASEIGSGAWSAHWSLKTP